MGGLPSFEFVPSDYKIKYIDSQLPATHNIKGTSTKGKIFMVILAKDVTEEFV